MTKAMATLIGFVAVLLWALLALFTAASGSVPPFQLAAMTFAIGGVAGMVTWVGRPDRARALLQPWPVWAVGVGGLFGYHFLYFSALRAAPPVDASLIAYLWPLLIVLFSVLAPGERLGVHHIVGALLGFVGAGLIVTKGEGLALDMQYSKGYALALVAALFWSSYSVLSRRFADVPTDVVTGFCLATSFLALICHFSLEETVMPQQMSEWLAILGLGLGPVGLAFFVWDIGVKKGDIQVLGAASYSAPLLSTLVLVVMGFTELTWVIAGACALITLGAVVAAKDMLFK